MILEVNFKNEIDTKIPAERQGSSLFGILNHLGPSLGFCLVAEFTHFSWLPMFLAFFGFSFLGMFLLLWAEKKFPSVELDPISWSRVTRGLSLVFFKGVGIGGLFVATGAGAFQYLFKIHTHAHSWLGIAIAVAFTDLGYYLTHRFLNHSRNAGRLKKWYRRNHSVHHSIEALDFFRGNISSLIDTAITGFQIPLILIGAVLGLSITSELTAYALILLLQSTHHVNHTFNIGWLRYVFVDNHSHKLHHCPRGYLVNFAAILSLWDRLFGTYYENWKLSSNYMEKHRMPLPIQQRPVYLRNIAPRNVQPEPKNSALLGCLVHFGPGAALYSVGVWTGFSPVPLLMTFFIVSSVAMLVLLAAEKYSPNVELKSASLKEAIVGTSHVFLTAVGAGTAVVVGGWWVLRKVFVSPLHLHAWISVLAAVVLSDSIYYLLHRYLNHGTESNEIKRWFRKNHQIHHSVPVLDFMRGSVSSFADTAVTGFQIPLWIASALLGMDLIPTLTVYALLLILEGTHHVNHSFNIGPLRYIFIDNHAHQMHHCPGGWLINQGVIFSLWDRMFGTYYEDRNISPSFIIKHRLSLPIQLAKIVGVPILPKIYAIE